MGIPNTGTDYTETNPPCSTVFPTTTPKYLFASFTGIMLGDYWTSPNPGAGNGMYVLHNTYEYPCIWNNGAVYDCCQVSIVGDEVWVGLYAGGMLYCRFAQIADAGIWSFANSHDTSAFRMYYGGTCQVAWIKDGNSPTLKTLADLMNFAPGEKSFFDFINSGDEQMTARIANKQEDTNALIQWDYT